MRRAVFPYMFTSNEGRRSKVMVMVGGYGLFKKIPQCPRARVLGVCPYKTAHPGLDLDAT